MSRRSTLAKASYTAFTIFIAVAATVSAAVTVFITGTFGTL